MREATPTAEKQSLRRQLRARRRDVNEDQRQIAANRAATLVQRLPGWHQATRVACYLATPEEFDCSPLLLAAQSAGKYTFLPGMAQGTVLHFLQYTAGDSLREARYGIFQPMETAAAVSVTALDIMFLPLVAWNTRGMRLGMGAGYYDRALSDAKPALLVGVGYDCQEHDSLPREAWDVPMDYVLTGTRLVKCLGG
ncbi:MAG: 5-formyltetrahydrofolate cyclo-ligase [Chromatocurvus sp.]